MKLANVLVFFFLLVNFAYPSINEYFPTLADYKLLGDRAYDQAMKSPSIKPNYDEGAASVEGLIIYLQSALRHDEIDEDKLKKKFDLLKSRLIPLTVILNGTPMANVELNHSDRLKNNMRFDLYAQNRVGALSIVNVNFNISLDKLWEEISNHFKKLHEEKIKANEEDIKQLDRYIWKK